MNYDMAKVSGNWMTNDKKALKNWVDDLIEKVEQKCAANSVDQISNGEFQHTEVEDLKNLIESEPEIYVLTNQMIEQALEYSEKDPSGAPQIKDYKMMLKLIDYIMSTAPEYMQPDASGRGLIGFPINAVLDWCMGTPAGYAFFLTKKVNECFGKILKTWCDFLKNEKSLYVLNTDKNGWMCKEASDELKMEQYIYKPNEKHWGFSSWNDFFTRKFKEGIRPIAEPDNPKVIVSACESAPYRISTNVQEEQKFWLKGQPYSLKYMLNQSEYVKSFVGGTVYQAFLSATRYHRWHSPVTGEIKKIDLVSGTYYSEIQEFPYDDAGPNDSQGFITQVATRAIIYIQCDDPIGLMCFMAVGMAEVSSCKVEVEEGWSVKKGDPLGYFQFGGSTHCLIFRKNVIEEFVIDAIPAEDFNNSTIIQVNSKLAVTR